MQTRQNEMEPIIVKGMTDNETWHYCLECGKNWKEKFSTPGLLLSVKTCRDCNEKVKVS